MAIRVIRGENPASVFSRPLPVKPDLFSGHNSWRSLSTALARARLRRAGGFSHGCLRHYTRPKSRRAFWEAKIAAHRDRGRRVDRALRAGSPRSSLRCGTRLGCGVLHLWEHAHAGAGETGARSGVRIVSPEERESMEGRMGPAANGHEGTQWERTNRSRSPSRSHARTSSCRSDELGS